MGAPRRGGLNVVLWFGGTIALIMGVLWAISTFQPRRTIEDITNDIMQRRTIDPRATLDAKWWPSDFTAWSGDRSLAWRWATSGEISCTFSGPCWGVIVIARDGCPRGMYGEVSLEDSSGAAIGYTNDTMSGIAAGQRAKLVFDAVESNARKARLTELNCHG